MYTGGERDDRIDMYKKQQFSTRSAVQGINTNILSNYWSAVNIYRNFHVSTDEFSTTNYKDFQSFWNNAMLNTIIHILEFCLLSTFRLLSSSSSSSLLSPLYMVFTIIYLKQTMFVGYILLQLFCIYSLC